MRFAIFLFVLLLLSDALSSGQTPSPEVNEGVTLRSETVRGFIHPGIGFTRDVLENARKQVIARREPWWSSYQKFASHPHSAEQVSCRNQSTTDPSKPDSDAFQNRGMIGRLRPDADKALRQALMYWFTGKECHRANAMNIIRTWSKMDPAKYKSFPEDHIHAAYPAQNLMMAAEISRYSLCPWPELEWSDADTTAFTDHFVNPAVSTFFSRNGQFMNQAGYPMAAAIAGFIFTNNPEGYAQRVEWFTMNREAPNPGWSFSIHHLARLVDTDAITGKEVSPPIVELVEMGRDQAHAGGDVDIFMNISRMLNAQGTKVDPTLGTISEDPAAVGPYEFLDDRILAAADHFCRYMLGYDTPWIPTPSDIGPDGSIRQIYPRIANSYRGRLRGLDFWDAHYYYTYSKKIDVSRVAPYYDRAFRKRVVHSDTEWIFIPAAATGEGARVTAHAEDPSRVEIERFSTLLDPRAIAMEEDGTGFIAIRPRQNGTRIAILNSAAPDKTIWMRVRSNATTEITLSGFKNPWLIPETGGRWRLVAYRMDDLERLGDIVYFDVNGSEYTRLDLDCLLLKADANTRMPEFSSGGNDLRSIAYVGAPIRLDFSATAGSRIESIDLPEGATLDPATGLLEWKPQSAGTFQFTITASLDEAFTGRRVTLIVLPDRRSALAKIAEARHPDTPYIEAGVRRSKELYDEALASIDGADEAAFYERLLALQGAFSALQPLTPLLPDGSMDFPGLLAATSTLPGEIAFLADGNDDTYAVHTSARSVGHVFDFGEGFRVSVRAFAAEGRLNFETRTQDAAFFGSEDGKKWIQLTPSLDRAPKELTRLSVNEGMMDKRFRFLKIQKTSRQSAPIFEPAEIRIFGQRFEVP